jgi:lysyl-tRNA synthetase, class II
VYWNFEDNIRFTEQMFDYFFDHIPEISKKVLIADKDGNEREVDFTTPRQKIDYISQIKLDSGIDVSIYTATDEAKLRTEIKAKGFDWKGIETQATATMIDYLYKKVTRPKIVGPAFIMNYPKTMQPLARQSDKNPNIVEQFQVIVNGWEILKAYSELVDPIIQQANFDEQSGAAQAGDSEATKADDEFVTAMEHGMPPQSGWGMGIDRILAMLTRQTNIRDVIMFPMMKKNEEVKGKE